jgi:hypothetical protein
VVPAQVQLLEQPRHVDQAAHSHDHVEDIGERAVPEYVRDHVLVEQAEDAPVEGAEHHEQQCQGLEPLDHLHGSPPAREIMRMVTS